MCPPSKIRSTKRNNNYTDKTLQEMMRKGAMVMITPYLTISSSYPQPPS
jgi:hypothetical protein